MAIEPLTKPVGFDWRTDVALIGGIAAKEAIVSTLGTAYSLGEQDPEEATSLAERLAQDPNWNKATALSLMLFVLLYSPCSWPSWSSVRRRAAGVGLRSA